MEKLKELVSICKGSVEISVNNHKDYYQSVEGYVGELDNKDIDEEILKEMIVRDSFVVIRAYPMTAISFFMIHHYDIDLAIDIMIEKCKEYNGLK